MLDDASPQAWQSEGISGEVPQRESRSLMNSTQAVYTRHALLLRVAGIMAILLLAFWVGMGPHWNYKYPLHVDEWFAMGFAQSTLDEGSLQYPNAYGPGTISYHHEMGFHLVLGTLKATTGLSWMGLYRLAPGILMALLVFMVYALGRRDGYGWAAALFVLLIPTSIRTLGPTFLVPVSAAMIFVPATLLVLHRLGSEGRGQSLWLLLILVGGTLLVYPPAEGIVTALVVLYLAAFVIEAVAARRYRAAGNLTGAIVIRMLIPIIVIGIWLPSLSKTVLQESVAGGETLKMVDYLGFNAGFFKAFGVIAVAIFLCGVLAFILSRRYGLRTYILPVFVGLLLLFLNVMYPRYQLGPEIIYERGWLYLGLFMAILAGYGIAYYFRSAPALMKKASNLLPHLRPDLLHAVIIFVGIAVIAAAMTTGLVNKEREQYAGYYHMIDDQVYADFVWLGQHTIPEHKVVMMEPSLAWAYPPIAGPGNTVPGAVSAPLRSEWADQVRGVIATGNIDIEWLKQQRVSVLYTRLPGSQEYTQLENSYLSEVRPGIYLVSAQ